MAKDLKDKIKNKLLEVGGFDPCLLKKKEKSLLLKPCLKPNDYIFENWLSDLKKIGLKEEEIERLIQLNFQ